MAELVADLVTARRAPYDDGLGGDQGWKVTPTTRSEAPTQQASLMNPQQVSQAWFADDHCGSLWRQLVRHGGFMTDGLWMARIAILGILSYELL
jgi:hypothetical protein